MELFFLLMMMILFFILIRPAPEVTDEPSDGTNTTNTGTSSTEMYLRLMEQYKAENTCEKEKTHRAECNVFCFIFERLYFPFKCFLYCQFA